MQETERHGTVSQARSLRVRTKRVWETNRAGAFETARRPFATSKSNDNTTQMSVLIVGNKSLSSYKCAAKLGPSDSLITYLSWVCLCCLNCCLLGPNIPGATATESHKRAKKALDAAQHVFSSASTDKKQNKKKGEGNIRITPRPRHQSLF